MSLLDAISYEYDSGNREDAELFDNMIDECTPVIDIFGMKYNPSRVLAEIDPIAYSCCFDEYVDSLPSRWKCPICDKIHEDEDEAKYCCQSQPDDEEED